jgi:hypothetical protein
MATNKQRQHHFESPTLYRSQTAAARLVPRPSARETRRSGAASLPQPMHPLVDLFCVRLVHERNHYGRNRRANEQQKYNKQHEH